MYKDLMNTNDSPPENTGANERGSLSRRTIVKTAAWTVPAITLAVATPAHATSADSMLSLTVPASIAQNTSGAVVATVLDSKGRPWAGQSVTLSASPASALFSTTSGGGGSATITGVTGADGSYRVYVRPTDAATYTVLAQSGPLQTSKTFTSPSTDVLSVSAGFLLTSIQNNALGVVSSTLKTSSGSGISGRSVTLSVTKTGVTFANSGTQTYTTTTNASGVVSARLVAAANASVGSATITATSGSSAGSSTFNVYNPPASINFVMRDANNAIVTNLVAGQAYQFYAEVLKSNGQRIEYGVRVKATTIGTTAPTVVWSGGTVNGATVTTYTNVTISGVALATLTVSPTAESSTFPIDPDDSVDVVTTAGDIPVSVSAPPNSYTIVPA
jgi:hypothetical protein